MARPASEYPTELELAILKILWQRAPRNVDEVRVALAEAGRDLTYSSVITVMNIMVHKKSLKRKKNGRAFEFTPRVDEQRVHRSMLNDLVDRVFDGSASAVMLELLGASEITSEELDEIRKLISRKARELES
jgi:predicted transcriptional regulator